MPAIRTNRMRLGKAHREVIADVALRALAGRCSLSVTAPSWHVARQIFAAASEEVERFGGQPADSLSWRFPNGSRLVVKVAA